MPQSLELVEELQRTGDIFFPQSWLSAAFGSYQTKKAWRWYNNSQAESKKSAGDG
jgi:aminopeptidase N